jgi:hypothetical protein
MEENEKTQLSKTAEAVLEKGVTLEVDILHPTFWQRLRKRTKKNLPYQACIFSHAG